MDAACCLLFNSPHRRLCTVLIKAFTVRCAVICMRMKGASSARDSTGSYSSASSPVLWAYYRPNYVLQSYFWGRRGSCDWSCHFKSRRRRGRDVSAFLLLSAWSSRQVEQECFVRGGNSVNPTRNRYHSRNALRENMNRSMILKIHVHQEQQPLIMTAKLMQFVLWQRQTQQPMKKTVGYPHRYRVRLTQNQLFHTLVCSRS